MKSLSNYLLESDDKRISKMEQYRKELLDVLTKNECELLSIDGVIALESDKKAPNTFLCFSEDGFNKYEKFEFPSNLKSYLDDDTIYNELNNARKELNKVLNKMVKNNFSIYFVENSDNNGPDYVVGIIDELDEENYITLY